MLMMLTIISAFRRITLKEKYKIAEKCIFGREKQQKNNFIKKTSHILRSRVKMPANFEVLSTKFDGSSEKQDISM